MNVADELEFATNAQAKSTHGGTIGHVSCVAGDPGNYACSYVRAVGSTRTCAVAIVQWTPNGMSSYRVQTAGRVALAASRCGPVTKVLHVLGTSG